MQEEKSAVYTVILGVCLFLCLLMLGNMLMGLPHPRRAMQWNFTSRRTISRLC